MQFGCCALHSHAESHKATWIARSRWNKPVRTRPASLCWCAKKLHNRLLCFFGQRPSDLLQIHPQTPNERGGKNRKIWLICIQELLCSILNCILSIDFEFTDFFSALILPSPCGTMTGTLEVFIRTKSRHKNPPRSGHQKHPRGSPAACHQSGPDPQVICSVWMWMSIESTECTDYVIIMKPNNWAWFLEVFIIADGESMKSPIKMH